MNLLEFEDVNQLIGRTLSVTMTIHGAKGLPEQLCTETFAEYEWIDEAKRSFKTEKTQPYAHEKNPTWEHSVTHELYLSNYVVNQLSEATILVKVFGRISHQKMDEIITDFAKRPETAAIVSPEKRPDEPFYEENGGDMQMLKIEEDSEEEAAALDTQSKTGEESKGHSKLKYEMDSDMVSETTRQKELQLEKENDILKQQMEEMRAKMDRLEKAKLETGAAKVTTAKSSNCCQIF